MFPSKTIIPGILALLALLLGGNAAMGQEDTREAHAAARTILSAFHNQVYNTGRVPESLLEEVQSTCEGDSVYCAMRKGLVEDGQKVNVKVRVDMTRPYENTQAMPTPKGWERSSKRYDAGLDAVVRYRVKKGRKQVGMVDIRSMRDGIYFYLGTAQLAARGETASVNAAVKRAQVLFQAATENGLTGQDLPQVTLQTGEYAGKAMVDSDTAYVMAPLEGPVSVRFDVFGRSSNLAAGEPYDIEVELPSLKSNQRGRAHVTPSTERTGLGWRIESKSLEAVPLTLTINRNLFDELRGKKMDAVIPVVFRAGGGRLRIFLQLVTWKVIISRFELIGTADAAMKSMRERLLEDPKMAAKAGRGDSTLHKFNDFKLSIGNLVDAWNTLQPQVAPGSDDPSGRIVAGWAVNQQTQDSFIRAVTRKDDPGGWMFVSSDRLRPEWQVAIARPPVFTASKDSESESDDEFADFDEDEEAENGFINTIEHNRRTMDLFYVNTVKVTVHRIGHDLSDSEDDLRDPAFLAEKLKEKAEDEPLRELMNEKPFSSSFRQALQDERAIEVYTSTSYWGHGIKSVTPFTPRSPGAYEVRLSVSIGRRDMLKDLQQVSVAIRVLAAPMKVKFLKIQWETGRGGI